MFLSINCFSLSHRLQALSAEVSNAGAVSGGEVDPSTLYNRRRRLTSLYSSYGPEAAAITEARNMASKRKMGPQLGTPTTGKGPSSLFIFSDDNFIRRHTRFIIEWPYPFPQTQNSPFGDSFGSTQFLNSTTPFLSPTPHLYSCLNDRPLSSPNRS